MCEMQETVVFEKQEPTDECAVCMMSMYGELDRIENENTVAQDIFEKVFRRRAKWRKRAETAELDFVKLREQFLEEREHFDAERKALEEKRRDEVAKALGYKNIAEVIGLSQVDYKLICDELYSEVEALEFKLRKQNEGEHISFTDALREVRGYEASANKRAKKAEERMYEAIHSENNLKKKNQKQRNAICFLATACVGFIVLIASQIIQNFIC